MNELRKELSNTETIIRKLDNISFILRIFFILFGGSLCITFTTFNLKYNISNGEVTYIILGFFLLIINFFLAYIVPYLIDWKRAELLNIYHINYKLNKLTKNVVLLDDLKDND